jgi:predicted nucleic acid-binding protein
MKNYILDSFALLVFFEQQKDWKKVERFLVDASTDVIELLMSGINYGEIFYITAQREGTEEANRVMKVVDSLPIKIVYPDKELTIAAAEIKAGGGISYADCFAASLAIKHKATLITGDPEFKKLGKEISLVWIEK